MARMKRGSHSVRGNRCVKRGGRATKGLFCSTCDEMPELMNNSPNNDENLERLSRHLSKLNIKPKKKGGKRNFIKF